MLFTKPLLSLAAVAQWVAADVKFTVPAAGASVPGGTTFTVTWTDSGTAPLLSTLSTYQLFLMSGSNAAPQQLYSLAPSTAFTAGSTLSVSVPITEGGSTENAYFLGMLSVAKAGGTIWNYSDRFTLTGMTGVFSSAVITGLLSVTDTTGPAAVNNIVTAIAPGAAATAADQWAVPYNMQTGTIRYAPMQPVPGTRITKTNTDPLWPTSSVSYPTAPLPIPTVLTTLTQAGTFSAASHANTAAATSSPVDDMQKYLNRWKD